MLLVSNFTKLNLLKFCYYKYRGRSNNLFTTSQPQTETIQQLRAVWCHRQLRCQCKMI